VTTHTAVAAAMISRLLDERLRTGHATTLGAASGLVAGLVAITPCAGFVNGMSPIYIGLIAGAVCAVAVSAKFKLGFDDSLDVVGVHMVGGIVGSLAVGLFAATAANPAVVDEGVFNGGGLHLLGEQALAVIATLAYSGIVTGIILLVMTKVMPNGIRVDAEDEEQGLDLSQHSETAYAYDRV